MADARHQGASLPGLVLALVGFALLSMGDAIVKTMADAWSGLTIGVLRYCFAALGLAGVLALREGRAGFRCPRPWVQIGRGVSAALASGLFFIALGAIPLAEATAIQFTSPIIVAVLSGVFLGERAPRLTWLALLLAMGGVAIVIRPNFETLGVAGVLPLGSAFFMALMMIFNRMAAGSGSALLMQMLFSAIALPVLVGMATLGHVSGVGMLAVDLPDWTVVVRCLLVACSASVAHGLIFMATERMSAANMAPMSYVQLLIASALGALFFDHVPDALSLIGSGLIVVAGLVL